MAQFTKQQGIHFSNSRLNIYKANMPSTITTTPSMIREELFKLWKKRHEKYLQKARETLEKNKTQRYERQ